MFMIHVRGFAVVAVLTTSLWPALASEALAQAAVAVSSWQRGLTARGAWSAGATYLKDDLVIARGSTWRAKRANTGKVPGQTQPSTAAYWELFAGGFNPLGAWISSTRYQPDDVVTFKGSTWRAKGTNLNKVPGGHPAFWE